MAKNNNLTDFLTDIATTIRNTDGSTSSIDPQDFSERIVNYQNDIVITPAASEQTVTKGAGYMAIGTLKVKANSEGPKATVTSGTSYSSVSKTITYDSTNTRYNVALSGTVSAPTVGTAGYISSSAGTKNPSTATGTTTLPRVALGAAITGTVAATPVISNVTASVSGKTQITAAPSTTTSGISTYYMAVNTAEKKNTITATPSVSTAGYGDTTNYGKTTATASAGANASGTYYIPIATAEFEVSGASVKTKTGKAGYVPADTTVGTVASGSVTINDSSLSVSPMVIPGSIAVATGNISLTAASSQPTTGYYIKVTGGNSETTGSATAGETATVTKTAGYITAGTLSVSSTGVATALGNSTDQYYSVASGAITNNTTLPSGSTSSGTINRDAYIKIGAGYYGSDLYYKAQAAQTLDGDAVEANVLYGKTFYSNSYTKKTGSMTNNGAISATKNPTFSGATASYSYTVPAGYHNGSGTVSGSVTMSNAVLGVNSPSITPSISSTYTSGSGYAITGTATTTASVSTAGYASTSATATGTASISGYVAQNSFATGTAPSGTTPTDLAKNTVYKLSSGYYPTDRYYKTQADPTLNGDAGTGNVLSGKTFYSNSYTKQTGTMTNNGAVSATLDTTTTSYTVPAGYHNGSGTVSITTQTKSASGSGDVTPDSGKVLSKVTVGAGSATPGATYATLSAAGTSPTTVSSRYFKITPTASVDTAGWISSISNGTIQNYTIQAAEFEVSGASVKTKSGKAGWVDAATTVGTVASGSATGNAGTITYVSHTQDSTDKKKFTVTGSVTAPAPTVSTGYVSSGTAGSATNRTVSLTITDAQAQAAVGTGTATVQNRTSGGTAVGYDKEVSLTAGYYSAQVFYNSVGVASGSNASVSGTNALSTTNSTWSTTNTDSGITAAASATGVSTQYTVSTAGYISAGTYGGTSGTLASSTYYLSDLLLEAGKTLNSITLSSSSSSKALITSIKGNDTTADVATLSNVGYSYDEGYLSIGDISGPVVTSTLTGTSTITTNNGTATVTTNNGTTNIATNALAGIIGVTTRNSGTINVNRNSGTIAIADNSGGTVYIDGSTTANSKAYIANGYFTVNASKFFNIRNYGDIGGFFHNGTMTGMTCTGASITRLTGTCTIASVEYKSSPNESTTIQINNVLGYSSYESNINIAKISSAGKVRFGGTTDADSFYLTGNGSTWFDETISTGKTLHSLTNSGTITTLTNSGTISTLALGSGTITNASGSGTISNLGASGTAGSLIITKNGYSSSYRGTVTIGNNTDGTVDILSAATEIVPVISITGLAATVQSAKTLTSLTNSGTITTFTNSGTITNLNLNSGTISTAYGTGTITNLGKSGTAGTLNITTNGYSNSYKGTVRVKTNTYGEIYANYSEDDDGYRAKIIGNVVYAAQGNHDTVLMAITDSSGNILQVSGDLTTAQGATTDVFQGTGYRANNGWTNSGTYNAYTKNTTVSGTAGTLNLNSGTITSVTGDGTINTFGDFGIDLSTLTINNNGYNIIYKGNINIKNNTNGTVAIYKPSAPVPAVSISGTDISIPFDSVTLTNSGTIGSSAIPSTNGGTMYLTGASSNGVLYYKNNGGTNNYKLTNSSGKLKVYYTLQSTTCYPTTSSSGTRYTRTLTETVIDGSTTYYVVGYWSGNIGGLYDGSGAHIADGTMITLGTMYFRYYSTSSATSQSSVSNAFRLYYSNSRLYLLCTSNSLTAAITSSSYLVVQTPIIIGQSSSNSQTWTAGAGSAGTSVAYYRGTYQTSTTSATYNTIPRRFLIANSVDHSNYYIINSIYLSVNSSGTVSAYLNRTLLSLDTTI